MADLSQTLFQYCDVFSEWNGILNEKNWGRGLVFWLALEIWARSARSQSLQQNDSWRRCSTQAVKLMLSEKERHSRLEVHFQIFNKDFFIVD